MKRGKDAENLRLQRCLPFADNTLRKSSLQFIVIDCNVILFSANDFSGDDDSLDVGGAFVDLEALDVPVESFDGVFTAVAPATMQQDRFVGRPGSNFSSE